MLKILAAASAGGHWEQMMLLRNTLDEFDVHYATTLASLPKRDSISAATVLPDCNRDQFFKSFKCLICSAYLVLRIRPDVVISTGAAPGFFCILFGRIIGARTLWIDSVANAEQLSMCGKLSRIFSTRCITQWEHLEHNDNPCFVGSLL